jgi:DnaJ-class molecular chaperone
MNFGFNRKSYKPCPSCKGVGFRDRLCSTCHGYGSRGLALIMRSKAITMGSRVTAQTVAEQTK